MHSAYRNSKYTMRVFRFFIAMLMTPLCAVQAAPVTNAWELPPLVLDDTQGSKHNLYDWHGKIIMLNFWASWCAPCQAEIPDFIAYQQRYEENGLQVIGIGVDDQDPVKNFVRTFGIDYPVLVARPADFPRLLPTWGNPGQVLPYTVVIDREGRIRYSQIGILDHEAFDDYIRPLLTAPSK